MLTVININQLTYLFSIYVYCIYNDGDYFIGDFKNGGRYNWKQYSKDGTLKGTYKDGKWSPA